MSSRLAATILALLSRVSGLRWPGAACANLAPLGARLKKLRSAEVSWAFGRTEPPQTLSEPASQGDSHHVILQSSRRSPGWPVPEPDPQTFLVISFLDFHIAPSVLQ